MAKKSSQKKRARYLRFWFSIIGTAIVLLMTGSYLIWQTLQLHLSRWEIPPITITLSLPENISANEVEDMQFGVENHDDSMAEVTIRMDHSGPIVSFLGVDGTNTCYSGPVNSHEQINRIFKLYVPCDLTNLRSILGQHAGLSLWGNIKHASFQKTEIFPLPITIAAVPWARKISYVLMIASFNLMIWIAKELSQRIYNPS